MLTIIIISSIFQQKNFNHTININNTDIFDNLIL